jgi:hypothetical protein
VSVAVIRNTNILRGVGNSSMKNRFLLENREPMKNAGLESVSSKNHATCIQSFKLLALV